MATNTHHCPGCGKAGIASSRLACPPCWFRVPKDLRDAVWAGWKVRAVYPAQHRAAVGDALDWFRRDRSGQSVDNRRENPGREPGGNHADPDDQRGNREQEAHQPEQQKKQDQSLHNPHRSPRVW